MAEIASEFLIVTARLKSGVVFNHPLMLDGILGRAVANRLGLRTVPQSPDEVQSLDIPIAMSPCGRFALCSEAQGEIEEHETRYKQRRPLVEQLARFAPKATRVQITAGLNKAYRVPYRMQFMADDVLTWWCIGDHARISELLQEVFFLGKHAGSGKGEVSEWDVQPCEGWDGFPILRGGVPLRSLPEGYPGITSARYEHRVLRPPYWMRTKEEVCAVAGN